MANNAYTKSEMDVLYGIVAFLRTSPLFSPTLQEISKETGIAKSSVFKHVKNLERKGVLTTQPKSSRSIAFTDMIVRARLESKLEQWLAQRDKGCTKVVQVKDESLKALW